MRSNFFVFLIHIFFLLGCTQVFAQPPVGQACAPSLETTPFLKREAGQRMLTTNELEKVKQMNSSFLCQGNCVLVSGRVTRYLNTGDESLLAQRGFFDRVQLKEVYLTGNSAHIEIGALAEEAQTQGLNWEWVKFNKGQEEAIVSRLQSAGPGSHAYLSGEYNEPGIISSGHAFNLVNVETESGPVVKVMDGYSPGRFTQSETQSVSDVMREYRDGSFHGIIFTP